MATVRARNVLRVIDCTKEYIQTRTGAERMPSPEAPGSNMLP